eukprot:10986028-Prorocentrum_lima.AAC.1
MTSSLVGSEMCIRDRTFNIVEYHCNSRESYDGRWNKAVPQYTCWRSICEKGLGGYGCERDHQTSQS